MAVCTHGDHETVDLIWRFGLGTCRVPGVGSIDTGVERSNRKKQQFSQTVHGHSNASLVLSLHCNLNSSCGCNGFETAASCSPTAFPSAANGLYQVSPHRHRWFKHRPGRGAQLPRIANHPTEPPHTHPALDPPAPGISVLPHATGTRWREGGGGAGPPDPRTRHGHAPRLRLVPDRHAGVPHGGPV